MGSGGHVEDQYQMWCALGLEWKLACMIADLGLEYTHGRLIANQAFQRSPSVHDDIVSCIMGVLRLSQFAESRWISVGKSFRPLVCGLLFGLDALIKWARWQPHMEFHIAEWDLLDENGRSN